MKGPSISNTTKYGIAKSPTLPYFGFRNIRLCRQSVRISPRCQRVRCRRRTRNDSGASVQQTGSGTKTMRYLRSCRSMCSCRRTTSSRSSVSLLVENPPIATTASFRYIPKAPEMIRRARAELQPTRPVRKARRYSTTWKMGSGRAGTATWTTRPSRTSQPFAIRTMPPEAIVSFGFSMNGFTTRSSALSSMIESASIEQNRG
jgi:hypothetical protein